MTFIMNISLSKLEYQIYGINVIKLSLNRRIYLKIVNILIAPKWRKIQILFKNVINEWTDFYNKFDAHWLSFI